MQVARSDRELQSLASIIGTSNSQSHDELRRQTFCRRLNMLNLTARWCHNVLLAAMGLLTIALVFSAL